MESDQQQAMEQVSSASLKDNISGMPDEAKTQRIGLLDLPPEIWSKICKLAVLEEKPIRVLVRTATTYHEFRDLVRQPGITRTCRAIREECLHDYYRHNTFIFDWEWPLKRRFCKWLRYVGGGNRRNMPHVYIRSLTPHNLKELHAMSATRFGVSRKKLKTIAVMGIDDGTRNCYYKLDFSQT